MQHETKLLSLLKKKRSFFEAILDLTEEESSLSISDWISTLEQKKVLLSCIDEIDAEISPFKAAFHQLSQDVVEELDKIKDIVKDILHLDSSNFEKRKKQFDEDLRT